MANESDGFQVGSRHNDSRMHPNGWNPSRDSDGPLQGTQPDRGTAVKGRVRGEGRDGKGTGKVK